MLSSIILRPADPDHDFRQLAAWFSILEDEPSTEASLQAYYEKQRERIWQKVAVDEAGELVGFYWVARDRLTPDRVFFFCLSSRSDAVRESATYCMRPWRGLPPNCRRKHYGYGFGTTALRGGRLANDAALRNEPIRWLCRWI